jgi:hypothetical protein
VIYIYTALLFLACFLLLGCFCALRCERDYREFVTDVNPPLDKES